MCQKGPAQVLCQGISVPPGRQRDVRNTLVHAVIIEQNYTVSRYGRTKITSEIARFIVKQGISGKPGSVIVKSVEEKYGVRVSVHAVNRVKRINRKEIGEQAKRQWEEAIATEEYAVLENRLAVYRGIIDRELAKEKPNNRVILDAVIASGQDVSNTYRLMVRMSHASKEDEQQNSKQRYLNELNTQWSRYIKHALSMQNEGGTQPA